jgi:SH3-like domain-containing protein
VRVLQEYIAQYPDPITVRAGERVVVGEDDPKFPGWRWCTGPDGRSGWVPEELLDRAERDAVMRQDYTARELSVRAGVEVILHRVVSGWAWVSTADGGAGWIPQSCIGGE